MVDLSYQSSVEPESLSGRPNPRFPDEVSPNTYGEQIGKGIEDAGSVLQRVHDQVQLQAQQAQHADASNQLTVLATSLTHDPNNGAFTKQGKDAFGLTQQYLPKYDQQAQSIVDSVPDPRARVAAAQSAAQIRSKLSEQLDSHELQQHKEFGINTAQASVQIATQAGAANYNHPDIVASNLDTVGISVDRLGQMQGWSPEQTAEIKQAQFSKFHSGVIDRILADNKIGMAQTYLDSAKSSMDAQAVWSAQKAIDTQNREVQTAQKQDIADRYQDSMRAAQFGLPNAIQVSRAELSLLHPNDGDRYWHGLQTIAAAGAQAQQYDQMTPDQVIADRDSHKPTSGGPGATAQIDAYEMRQRAAQQSLAARQQDPAKFAVDTHVWQPLDTSSPDTLARSLLSRSNTQPQVQAITGVSTPIISNNETKMLTAGLSQQPPGQRIQSLASLRNTLSDPAYRSLMDQVAPGDPITGLAGNLLAKQDPANQPTWQDPAFVRQRALAAQTILEGKDILTDRGDKEKGIKSSFLMPSDADNKSTGLPLYFTQAMGGAGSDIFRGRAGLAETSYAAYKAAYVALANKAGNASGIVDPTLADRAAAMVIGNVVVPYNNSQVVVPNGMDPTRFEGVMNTARDQALRAAGYNDKDVAALRDHGLRELGNSLGTGRYTLINGNGDALTGRDGKAVIVDLNQYREPFAPLPGFMERLRTAPSYRDIASDGN